MEYIRSPNCETLLKTTMPSRRLTVPARNPRMLCACQPEACCSCAIEAPLLLRNSFSSALVLEVLDFSLVDLTGIGSLLQQEQYNLAPHWRKPGTGIRAAYLGVGAGRASLCTLPLQRKSSAKDRANNAGVDPKPTLSTTSRRSMRVI